MFLWTPCPYFFSCSNSHLRYPMSYIGFFFGSQTSRFQNCTLVQCFIHFLIRTWIFFKIGIHVFPHGFLIHLVLQTYESPSDSYCFIDPRFPSFLGMFVIWILITFIVHTSFIFCSPKQNSKSSINIIYIFEFWNLQKEMLLISPKLFTILLLIFAS
jgi:hypothetical protein